MISFLYRSSKYLFYIAMLFLYESKTRPKMENCCHISLRQNVVSILLNYFYFHGKCPIERHPLVPTVQVFPVTIHNATYSVVNHLHSISVPLMKSKFHSNSLLSGKRYPVKPISNRKFHRTLKYSSLGVTIIFLIWHHKIRLLPLNLLRVALSPFVE